MTSCTPRAQGGRIAACHVVTPVNALLMVDDHTRPLCITCSWRCAHCLQSKSLPVVKAAEDHEHLPGRRS